MFSRKQGRLVRLSCLTCLPMMTFLFRLVCHVWLRRCFLLHLLHPRDLFFVSLSLFLWLSQLIIHVARFISWAKRGTTGKFDVTFRVKTEKHDQCFIFYREVWLSLESLFPPQLCLVIQFVFLSFPRKRSWSLDFVWLEVNEWRERETHDCLIVCLLWRRRQWRRRRWRKESRTGKEQEDVKTENWNDCWDNRIKENSKNYRKNCMARKARTTRVYFGNEPVFLSCFFQLWLLHFIPSSLSLSSKASSCSRSPLCRWSRRTFFSILVTEKCLQPLTFPSSVSSTVYSFFCEVLHKKFLILLPPSGILVKQERLSVSVLHGKEIFSSLEILKTF